MSALRVAGVDEAGRGPLAGPVVAAAVILDPDQSIRGLADSKALSAARRERLAGLIRAQASAWAIGVAEVEEIDRLNILRATHLAMQRAVAALAIKPDRVLVDGNLAPALEVDEVLPVVGGDARIAEISAASILAKVTRDERMLALHQEFPQYGFDRHKGYPTAEHRALLERYGPTPAHRRSFAPVRQLQIKL
ncbi:MAG: ribonuclease HII [Wenzhouxiangellaceae bacterium]